MRKEVFYSLMAMTVVPVAANARVVNGDATPGTVVPDAISFDNQTVDLDGDLENGSIKWCAGDVAFTVNQELVPGKYTFKAHLTTTAAAVWVKIPGAVDANGKEINEKQNQNNYPDGRDIEVNFILKEATSNLQIIIDPLTDYEVADNKFYFLGNSIDGDSGLSFDTENFNDALNTLNNLINDYVNKVFNVYESQLAQQTMNSAKERVQGLITNVDDLTYQDFIDLGLDNEDLKQSPIYKDATKLFNQSTRIEAEYQANKMLKQLDDAIEASKEDVLDEDGNPTGEKVANPYLVELANKVKADIKKYKEQADDKTGAKFANGAVSGGYEDHAAELDPKALEEDGFDVNPEFPPLKDLQADVDRVAKPGGFGHVIADALKVSYEKNDRVLAELKEMYDEIGEVPAYKQEAASILDAANVFVNHYRAIITDAKSQVDAKKVSEMSKDFRDAILAQLAVADNNIDNDDKFIEDFYELYDNYKAKQAAVGAVGKPELTTGKELFGDDQKFKTRSDEYDELVTAALGKFTLPVLQDNSKKEDNIEVLDKEGKPQKVGYSTLPDDPSIAGDAIDNDFADDFEAYVDALDALAEAYEKLAEDNEAIDKAYSEDEGWPNESGYDNREYFKEIFHNAYWKFEKKNNQNISTPMTWVNAPGKKAGDAQAQDNTEYSGKDGIKNYLNKLKKQLEDRWGTYSSGTKTYTKNEYKSVDDYVTDDFLLGSIKEVMNALTTPDPESKAKVYKERGLVNAKAFAQLEDMLGEVKEAVAQLRERVASSPIYSANPDLYKDLKDGDYSYTVKEVDEATGDLVDHETEYAPAGRTWKEILFDYETAIKGWNEALAKALDKDDDENFDNHAKREHSLRLMRLRDKLAALYTGDDFTDPILKEIEHFTEEGGVIDQQETAYAEKAAEDNYDKWSEHLNPTDGALAKLAKRLDIDRNGTETGYKEIDPDGLLEPYFVGYDQPGADGKLDGKISDDELVNFKDWQYIQDYRRIGPGNPEALNADKWRVFDAFLNSFDKKLTEAQAIYDKWVTDADNAIEGKAKADWTKADYEKANVELGKANDMIKEVNNKLKNEFEQPLVSEIKAQREHQEILAIFNNTNVDADGNNESNMSYLRYTTLNFKKWDNGRKLVSNVKMKDCTNLNEAFLDLAKQLVKGGPEDQEAYDEAKAALHPKDLPLYERLEAIYADGLELRKALNEAYLQGNPMDQWKASMQAQYKALEDAIKAWVNDCAKEEEDIQANAEALAKLKELLDVNVDGVYDWKQLIQTDGSGNPILDEDGNFQMVDLMETPGIQNIIKNDKKAMGAGKVENMLEPVTYNEEDGTVTNLRTFEKQLASPEQLEGIEPTEFVAKARALREAAENAVGGELYERMKSFVEKLSRLNKARELDDNLNDLKKEFSNFAENILAIDEHAKENKAQYDAMTAIAKDMENQWKEADQYVFDNMKDAAAYSEFKQALNNAKNSNIVPFKEKIKKDYEEGHAWQDGGTVNEDPKAERINTKKEESDMGVAAGVALTQALDLLTGENNATVAEANAAAYKTFEANYAQATKEYYMLVDKLEQLKNLDLDTELYGDNFNKDDAEAKAADINEYLFGTATEKPKDAIDRIFREGTQEVTAANATKPVTAWPNTKSGQLVTFMGKFEGYLKDIDTQIDNAIADWASSGYADQVLGAATKDLENYAIYRATFRPIANMPEDAAKKAAYKKAAEDIIKANADYKALYEDATEVDQLIKAIKDSKKAKLGYTALLDINALYDEIKAMKDDKFFDKTLVDGQDAEAAKDAQFYIDYAQNHLFGEKGDKAVLEALEIALDEPIEDGLWSFEKIEEKFLNIVKEEVDGELVDVEVKAGKDGNHSTIITEIQNIVGFYLEKTEKDKDGKDVLTGEMEWVDDAAKCAWIHQIKANSDGQAQALATIATLIENTQAAWDEIKDFQVAPQFAEQAIKIQLALYDAEQKVTDPDFIVSTKSVKNTMKTFVQQFGTVDTYDPEIKKFDEYAAVLGTMKAESGLLPKFVDDAYEAEIEHLKADVNALRAEYKKFTEAGNEDGGHNAIIEGLWTEVNEAVSQPVPDEAKNFKEWERTDLVAIQAKIEAEYKALRAANGTAIDAEALVAALNNRLADAAANKVEDAYAAKAPDVTIAQQILEGLIGEAQTAIEASKDVDYEREKLEAMVQNVEKAIVARDNMAAKWTAFKEKYDDQLAAILDEVQDSKDDVNEWVDEEYDLAASEASAPIYAEAIAKGEEFATLFNEILGSHKVIEKEGKYLMPVSTELNDLLKEYRDLIEEAEDAAADFDLTNRLAALNQQLNVLKNKAENGVYSEDYLDDNNVDAKIQNIEDAIAQLLVDLETIETTVGTTDPGESYADLLERIVEFDVDHLDTEDYDESQDIIGGIQKDLDDLAEILGSNVLGDMNNDGKVTLADAKIIADIALEKAEMPLPGTDDFLHADVNEDGIIDITDASAAVNIYFYGNPEGINYWIPEEARNAENVKEAVNVTATKTAEGLTRLAISLDNAQAYTAFQMDLQLAEGMKLVAAHMSDRANSQYLMTNELDGTLRIAALSLKNEAFAGNNGDVLYLDFEVAEGAADDFARFQNVFFVTKNAKKVNFELGGITPTGIQSANAETALGQKFYDLSGRVKNSLKKGVNIVKDAAGNVKKVIVK